MQEIVFAPVPTYAALIAAYPENGAALDALPDGASFYVEDMMCAVRRSSNGNYWVPDRMPVGPAFTGSNAHWIGPANSLGVTSSAQHLRKWETFKDHNCIWIPAFNYFIPWKLQVM